METFVAIIFIVFGILQIVLFFKLWGMTNDVEEIKNYLLTHNPDNVSPEKVAKLVKNGKKAEAEETLEKVAEKLADDIMNQRLSNKVAKEKFAALESQYKTFGKTMPEYIASLKDML